MRTKLRQRRLIQAPWVSPMIAMRCAVIKIQAMVRRHQAILLPFDSRSKQKSKLLDKYLQAPSGKGYSDYCATRIQAWFRMIRTPKSRKYKSVIYQIAALQIQDVWREYTQNVYNSQGIEEAAAFKIQGTWRAYTNVRVYCYYRDLIRFQLIGDASQLLKTINPAEAKLLDKSESIHLRFRLGGTHFPPTLYYKLFTRQPVCDLGLFAPRADYTQSFLPKKTATIKQHIANIRVGKSYFGVTYEDKCQKFYQRLDNNPWRPVALHSLRDHLDDQQAQPKSTQPRIHSHKTLSKKRKLQKRKWLQQTYCSSHQDKQTSPPLLNDILIYHNDLLIAQDKEDTTLDSSSKCNNDDDNLLDWSKHLDYEDYIKNWSNLATSGPARRSSSLL